MIRETDINFEEIVSFDKKLCNSGLVNLLQPIMQIGSIFDVNHKGKMILFRYDEYVEKRLTKIFEDYQWDLNRQNSYKHGKYKKIANHNINKITRDMKNLEIMVNEIKKFVNRYGYGFYVDCGNNKIEVCDLKEITKHEFTHIGGRENEQSSSY